jgi:hypothetical protein
MRILIRPKPAATAAPNNRIDLRPTTITIRQRPLRILDFDCEARPLHWIGGDYVSKEITAIAWAWVGQPESAEAYLLGETDPIDMLRRFVDAFDRSDIVTGHFIRGYDLPLVSGALVEHQMPPLGKKLSQDTKLDLLRFSGLSKSQENLGSTLGLIHPKVQMNQAKWRSANRLEPEGLAAVRERVIGDVVQHIEMRQRLLELGYLSNPKLWESNSAEPLASYTP